jgi:glycosyltransferase involved in cell wall biosynthesis
VEVVVVGRCGIGRRDVPGVRHTGEVVDVRPYLQAADLAVCPLVSGSGTSLKAVEFLAAGLALVSTPTGVRGLGLTGNEVEICEPPEMPARVAGLASDAARRAALGTAGRRAAEDRFSWDCIGARAAQALDRVVPMA